MKHTPRPTGLSPTRTVWLLPVMLAAVAGGCQWPPEFAPPRLDGSDAPLSAWAAGPMVALTDQTAPPSRSPVYDAEDRTVSLHAAANEAVSFQIVVDAGKENVRGLEIEPSTLRGPDGAVIPAERIRLFRALPVHVERYPPWYLRLSERTPEPANFYDALAPLTPGEPLGVPPGERLVLWVDVAVPKTARPGEHVGTLTLRSDSHSAWKLEVRLDVWDFVLPDARPLPAIGGFDYRDLFAPFLERGGRPFAPERLERKHPLARRGLVLMRQLMVMAHEHRLDLFDKHIRPTLRRDLDSNVVLDWEDYDAIVGPYLDGTAFEDRIGVPAWPLPFSDRWPKPANYGGHDTERYAETARAILAACQERFAAAEAPSDKLFAWPYRGEVRRAGYGAVERMAGLARDAVPEVPILCRLPLNPPEASGLRPGAEFPERVDMSAPPAHWLDPSRAAPAAASGGKLAGVWLAPGDPPYLPSLGVLAGPADARAVPWFARKYDCAGLFLPEVLHWSQDDEAADLARTRLFHPGTAVGREAVLPSVRLKRLRRGLQDLGYLWLLEQHGRADVAEKMVDALVRYAGLDAAGDNYLDPRLHGWVRDPETWRQARELMAAEILAAMHRGEPTRQELLRQRIAWRTFENATHEIRVEQVRTHVTPVEAAPGGDRLLDMTLRIELYNEHDRPVDATVNLEGLPEGWRPVTPSATVAMGRGERAVVELRARGDIVPATAAGKLDVPLSVTADGEDRRELTASVPLVVAAPPAGAVRIDGVLDDWPMRAANTAGDFRLVGRRGEVGDGLAERQTQVFVLHDGERIYFAFRCEEPGMEPRAHPSNLVEYEQLLAVGEDLVEIVLDPGADAEGIADLYHIVVKANGVVRAERGVTMSLLYEPAGRWAAEPAVAVGQSTDDAWTVEIAIPLSAFGDEADARFWGANFARYATQGGEASSWAGSRRYFYAPEGLGTMFLPTRGPGAEAFPASRGP